MAKFSNLAKGALQGRVFDLLMPSGATDKIRIVPLVGRTDDEIGKLAAKFAVEHGGEPKDTDREFDRGLRIHTILHACQDVDSPIDRPEPYFSGIDEILDPRTGLDRDRIALLFEFQQLVQDEFAPRRRDLTPVEFVDWLLKTTEVDDGGELPFERSPRATQRAFMRGIAALAKASLLDRSTDGPSSPVVSTSSAATASASGASGES